MITEEEKYRKLKNKHQDLLNYWDQNNNPCIICGTNIATEKDHLPPKVLYPKTLRNSKTEFFTFPVCSECNRRSSDSDYLLSVLMALSLNQSTTTDPDLFALREQLEEQLKSSKKAKRRRELLKPYLEKNPTSEKLAININKLPVNETITKIVKSIYWLHSNGDILQNYNPCWWIMDDIDTTKENFIKKHLMTTNHELLWENRFISRFSIGSKENGVGGLISCSLHFYTGKNLGCGNNWFIITLPTKTLIENKSLYDMGVSRFGKPTIYPKMNFIKN